MATPTTELDRTGGSLTLAFADPEAVRSFLREAERQNGFLAALPEALEQFETLEGVLTVDGVAAGSLELAALQVFPAGPDGHPTALELKGWDDASAAAVATALEKMEAGEDPGATDDGSEVVHAAGETDPDEAPTAAPRGETMGVSPIFKIRKMTPPEKIRFAPRANRTERQILLRDSSPQVLLALLGNPYLESDDVVTLVKSPYAAANVLQRVASDRRWSSSFDIRSAVVKNPKTPTPLAISLLPRLRTPELRALARSQEIRETLKKAALKEYLKRTGSRR